MPHTACCRCLLYAVQQRWAAAVPSAQEAIAIAVLVKAYSHTRWRDTGRGSHVARAGTGRVQISKSYDTIFAAGLPGGKSMEL